MALFNKKNAWIKDILVRAGKTFVQGFVAYLVLALPAFDVTDKNAYKALAVGAVSAGISAVWNTVKAVK